MDRRPIGGFHYWWVVLLSPETLIFALFMVTDPRTIPSSPRARVLYAVGVGATCSVLMAPQTTEFATKVALLAGLACCSAGRGIWMAVAERASGTARGASTPPASGWARGRIPILVAAVVAPVILAAGVAVAGTNARTVRSNLRGLRPPAAAALAVPEPDPATLPVVQSTRGATALDRDAVRDKQQLARTLGWIVAVENLAFATQQPELLSSVDFGRRLRDRREELRLADQAGVVFQRSFRFTAMKMIVVRWGDDGTPLLGVHVNADVVERRQYRGGVENEQNDVEFDRVFVVRRADGNRWMLVDEVPPPFKMGRFPQ